EDVRSDKRLVAYWVGDHTDASVLREHLKKTLPDYMVPSAFVRLDALPLTRNGKLNRKALPATEYATDPNAYVAPRTRAETELCRIFADVLGVPRVGIDDNFFFLGGDSILSLKVVAAGTRSLPITAKHMFQ